MPGGVQALRALWARPDRRRRSRSVRPPTLEGSAAATGAGANHTTAPSRDGGLCPGGSSPKSGRRGCALLAVRLAAGRPQPSRPPDPRRPCAPTASPRSGRRRWRVGPPDPRTFGPGLSWPENLGFFNVLRPRNVARIRQLFRRAAQRPEWSVGSAPRCEAMLRFWVIERTEHPLH